MLATWENLPEPSSTDSNCGITSICVQERYWRKIVTKHVCSSREPWADLLGQTTVDQLAAAPHGPFDRGPVAEASKEALTILGNEVRSTLSRPLVLAYTSIREGGVDGQRWVLPLPSGPIAVIYVGPTQNNLVTCYFTGAASVNPRGSPNAEFNRRRWKSVLRELVAEHSVFDRAAQRFRLPDRRHRREKRVLGQQPEMCIDIRFVVPETWGFAGDTAGSEWTAPTWTWPKGE